MVADNPRFLVGRALLWVAFVCSGVDRSTLDPMILNAFRDAGKGSIFIKSEVIFPKRKGIMMDTATEMPSSNVDKRRVEAVLEMDFIVSCVESKGMNALSLVLYHLNLCCKQKEGTKRLHGFVAWIFGAGSDPPCIACPLKINMVGSAWRFTVRR